MFANTFHADEALFATWSRLIALLPGSAGCAAQPVDKPPLLFYATALLYPLLQTHAAWVARLVSWTAGLLAIPVTARLGRRLIGPGIGTWGPALLVALSPLAIQFSPTAFTDHLFVTLALGGLSAAAPARPAGRRPAGRAGLLLGLALAAKYQAILFLPPALALGLLAGWRRRELGALAAGLLLPVFLVVGWELLRSERFFLLSTQLANVGGLRLAWSWELGSRAGAWGALAGFLFGARWWSLLLLLAAAAAPLLLPRRQAGLRVLWLFAVAYAAGHWLLAIPVWDRYLLPLVAPAALLAAGSAAACWARIAARKGGQKWAVRTAAGLLVAVLWVQGSMGALRTARLGGFPLGASPTSDAGASRLAATLDSQPWGTVLYDHWLSWQWRYYFLNRPVYVHWFAQPADLAADLAVFGSQGPGRFLAVPENVDAAPLLRAAHEVGYDLALEQTFHAPGRADGILLYRVFATDE